VFLDGPHPFLLMYINTTGMINLKKGSRLQQVTFDMQQIYRLDGTFFTKEKFLDSILNVPVY
jgi:hypothetical protein